ncbi:MAG: phosphatidylinositol mannoside acyltransferase [Actinobacteria bacterium]|nr:phosphatidylinositol mannoside acyltransferase [Actinomycetota bacterium]
MSSLRDEARELRDQLVSGSFVAGWSAVKGMPEPVARRLFQRAADVAARREGAGARQLRENLRRVAGPAVSEQRLDELTRDGLRSYARYWLETFRLPAMDKRAVGASVERRTTGAEHIDAALAAGRSFILALPHMGNWDVAAVWLIDRHGKGFTTVAERLRPDSLFDRFVAYREGLGMEVLALSGGDRPPLSVLTDRLKNGGNVCLVADRDLSQSGIDVEFFGEPATMPGGPAMLAALTGAALLPVSLWFPAEGQWAQHISPEIEIPGGRLADRVRAGTRALAAVFETQIRAHPTDWHMLQPFWPADRRLRRPAAEVA